MDGLWREADRMEGVSDLRGEGEGETRLRGVELAIECKNDVLVFVVVAVGV